MPLTILAMVLALRGAMTSRSAQLCESVSTSFHYVYSIHSSKGPVTYRRSSMCRMALPRFQGSFHSSSST